MSQCFFPKDFIETTEGLIFAVVDQQIEQGRVLCFLRYVKENSGWKKYPTKKANALLKASHSQYLFYSSAKDTHLHAVPVEKIFKHHQPKKRLQTLLLNKSEDKVEQDLMELCELFRQNGLNLHRVGVTGSMLIGVQNEDSDIDLVLYGRETFFHGREMIRQLINSNHLQNLNDDDWLLSYDRRRCDISIDEYIRHEKRKFNKANINGRKFDISLLDEESKSERIKFTKCGKISLQALVIDDSFAFDYPARLIIDHPQATECVSYTATYTGQAVAGERVEIAGSLEKSEHGDMRIVVGSSREAEGEYIKVISWNKSVA